MKYYLVSYAYSLGFGHITFMNENYLNIGDAVKQISEIHSDSGIAIIAINKIKKSQYEEYGKTANVNK